MPNALEAVVLANWIIAAAKVHYRKLHWLYIAFLALHMSTHGGNHEETVWHQDSSMRMVFNCWPRLKQYKQPSSANSIQHRWGVGKPTSAVFLGESQGKPLQQVSTLAQEEQSQFFPVDWVPPWNLGPSFWIACSKSKSPSPKLVATVMLLRIEKEQAIEYMYFWWLNQTRGMFSYVLPSNQDVWKGHIFGKIKHSGHGKAGFLGWK